MTPSAVPTDNSPDPTDALLMSQIGSRDSAALAQLYDRHNSIVFALCVRMLRDRNEAEDVMLEVFWELWDRSARYDASRASPLTYLMRVTRSQLDRSIAGAPIAPESGTGIVDAASIGDFESDAAGVEPLAGTLRTEQRALVTRANLGTLPRTAPGDRDGVFDAMTHTEIAPQLKEPLGTIKSRIRQALSRLRESLGALNFP